MVDNRFMKILVTGGGGYIGSFMTRALLESDMEVSVLDNFSRGYKDAVDSRANILEGDILDNKFLETVFSQNSFEAIIHFAGYISVAESVKEPGMYFRDNVEGSRNILEHIKDKHIKFIFSSSAAVYGDPTTVPIPEDHTKDPTSPYGQSKLMIEQMCKWYNKAYGQPFAALRYFNACGAALDGNQGERHNPETHIIPKVIEAAQNGTDFNLFGDDYDTDDGSCVRDYIHVLDLADAHIRALHKLDQGSALVYNVGTGKGYSNKEVISAVEKISGKKINVTTKERRPGDPAKLIADCAKIEEELGFKAQYSDLETVISSAWQWQTGEKFKSLSK